MQYLEFYPSTKPYVTRDLQAIKLNNARDRLEVTKEVANLQKGERARQWHQIQVAHSSSRPTHLNEYTFLNSGPNSIEGFSVLVLALFRITKPSAKL